MSLTLYNTLTRSKQPFKPINEGHVGIYVCGPTVYGPPHLGHAKSYVSFDVLVKYLRQKGYNVRYVQNITDVGHLTDDADSGEDKIEKQARIDKVHPFEIADKYMFSYFRAMERLKVAPPNFYVRASQHIGEQIEAVKALIDKGHAYEIDGNVYFNVSSFPGYGRLSGRVLDQQQEAVRVEARTDKRDPRDFALWKKAEQNHILKWNSPWGPGYPGWHIECSVMSTKYLGESFDIHGGGIENMFPHHECEIAQSETLTGKPFARFWLHNNMVVVDGTKMGKSLGNFRTCDEMLSKYSPEALRAFILSSHYRSPTNYTEEAVQAAASGLERLERISALLRNTAAKDSKSGEPVGEKLSELCTETEKQVTEALDNDLDTPAAIAALYSFTSAMNKLVDEKALTAAGARRAIEIIELWGGKILGIVSDSVTPASESVDLNPIMDIIIEIRSEMKASRRFDQADLIRKRLDAAGILLEDTREGTRWQKK